MKVLPLGPNSTKFCTHNLCAPRKLEMQNLRAEGECRGPGVGVGWSRGRVAWWDARCGVKG